MSYITKGATWAIAQKSRPVKEPAKLTNVSPRALMLEKKGTDYKLYLKTEPQWEVNSENM